MYLFTWHPIFRSGAIVILNIMKRVALVLLGCVWAQLSHAQCFTGEYSTEWQWNLNGRTNWVNLLRLDLSIPLWKDVGSIEISSVHVAKINDRIIDDWQVFSNIEEVNEIAAIAVFGYSYEWKSCSLFVGVRNMNEDYFVSEVTSMFTNSSCGIFPTISASYPIANCPLSGLAAHFEARRDRWTFSNSLYNGIGHNGWNPDDNPFLLRPRKEGIFNVSELEYSRAAGSCFAGATVHTRQYVIDSEGNMSSVENSCPKVSCAWWIYAEQALWQGDGKRLSAMAQYSENTSRRNGCYRYGEIGCAYIDSSNQCGISFQYARFYQGPEHSLEITWKRQFSQILAFQPSFQYISNVNGRFTVLTARLYCTF